MPNSCSICRGFWGSEVLMNQFFPKEDVSSSDTCSSVSAGFLCSSSEVSEESSILIASASVRVLFWLIQSLFLYRLPVVQRSSKFLMNPSLSVGAILWDAVTQFLVIAFLFSAWISPPETSLRHVLAVALQTTGSGSFPVLFHGVFLHKLKSLKIYFWSPAKFLVLMKLRQWSPWPAER